MRTIREHLYLTTLILFGSLSFSNFQSLASINEATWEMQDQSGNLRTHPLNEDDLAFWYELQASPAVTALFRDGRPRTQEECYPQAQRSIERHRHGNPLVIHVVEVMTPQFGWKPCGTIVIGDSDKENYFELAGLSHPAIIQSTGNYLKTIDKDEMLQNKVRVDENDPDLIPIWGRHYASSITKLFIDQFLPILRKTKITDQGEYMFDGESYQGVIATSSNPASEKILENLGFKKSAKMEISRFGVLKWRYILDFSNNGTY